MKKCFLLVLLVLSLGIMSCGTNGGTSTTTDSTTTSGSGGVSGSGK